MQVIDCVRQKIHEKQLQKEIASTQKQITMVLFFKNIFCGFMKK
jgi:hypothetical protein